MINNRQAGRRNRGRSNGRPNGQNRGGGDNGNRIDNRARGNAAQLLEKYRNMARDAQLAGDRVNMEYYLQFADHYFRVLADNRSRQEEQNPQRGRNRDDGAFDGDDFDSMDDLDEIGDPRAQQQQHFNAQRGDEAGRRDNYRNGNDRGNDRGGGDRNADRGGNDRNGGERNYGANNDRPANANGGDNRRDRDFNRPQRQQDNRQSESRSFESPQSDARQDVAEAQPQFVQAEAAPAAPVAEESAPRRRGRPRKVREEEPATELSFDATLLPPAISRADNDSEGSNDGEPPRKRTRRARPAAEAAE